MARNFNPRREITQDQIEQSLRNRRLSRRYLGDILLNHSNQLKVENVSTVVDDIESPVSKSVTLVGLDKKTRRRTRRFSYRHSVLLKSEIKK